MTSDAVTTMSCTSERRCAAVVMWSVCFAVLLGVRLGFPAADGRPLGSVVDGVRASGSDGTGRLPPLPDRHAARSTPQHHARARTTRPRGDFVDLFEYQGKQLFARYGIPVSPGEPADTVDDSVAAAERVGYPVVVKAQVQ